MDANSVFVQGGEALDAVIKMDANGLIPAIIQDVNTGQVLMLGYMNRESLERTLKEGKACFWSRSRQKYWVKGESSGHFLLVRELRIDCDGDAVLVKCEPIGPTCHTNQTSCFYRRVDGELRVHFDGDEKSAENEKR